MKIGGVGLGQMGARMAQHLVRAGRDVTVYNRTQAKTKPLADVGAHVASSLHDLNQAEVVITMLADDAAVESFALDDERPNAAFGPGPSLQT